MIRKPDPYKIFAISQFAPSSSESTDTASLCVSTTGIRPGRFARTTSFSQPNSSFNTSRYRNSSADSA
jgi:hypothetical protein